MFEPTLVGENSFGEFDGAQFARRLFPGAYLPIGAHNVF